MLPYVVVGLLLALSSGAYVTYVIYAIYRVKAVRNEMEVGEQQYDLLVDLQSKQRQELTSQEGLASGLLTEIPNVPALRTQIQDASRREADLETKVSELQSESDNLQKIILAMERARTSAVEGLAGPPLTTILKSTPSLVQAKGWDPASSMIQEFNDIGSAEQSIRDQLAHIRQLLESGGVNRPNLQEQQNSLNQQLLSKKNALAALQAKYDSLVAELRLDRDQVNTNLSKLTTELASLEARIKEAQDQISAIQSKLKQLSAPASLSDIPATTAAVQRKMQDLTLKMRKVDDDFAEKATEFSEDSKKLGAILSTLRDRLLMNFKQHILFFAAGVLGCWLLHWGIFLRFSGRFYRRVQKTDASINFLAMFTVMVPADRYRQIIAVGRPPKLVIWYLGLLFTVYLWLIASAIL